MRISRKLLSDSVSGPQKSQRCLGSVSHPYLLTPASGAGVLKHGLSDREEGPQGTQCTPSVTALVWERRGGEINVGIGREVSGAPTRVCVRHLLCILIR